MTVELPRATIPNTQTHFLHSSGVGDEYEISVWLPPGYEDSTQSYPTLYLLDAPLLFGAAVPVVLGQMWDNFIPGMIVVGIGKEIDAYDDWWPIRNRDYAPAPLPSQSDSGKADAFLNFIEAELTPFIEATYRTDRDNRLLWGHSLGGAFVLHTMFSKPTLFKRYIATSPALVLEGETLVDYETALDEAISFPNIRLFVSAGSADEEFGPNIDAFVRSIGSRVITGLGFEHALLDGYAHISSAVPGFIRGLLALFSPDRV